MKRDFSNIFLKGWRGSCKKKTKMGVSVQILFEEIHPSTSLCLLLRYLFRLKVAGMKLESPVFVGETSLHNPTLKTNAFGGP